MRILNIALVVVMLGVVGVLSIGCGARSDTTDVTEDQLVTVQPGDLRIDVIAVGNLKFSYQEELTFEEAGTVEEVLVEVGDSVEEGQVLARLDTSEWEEYLASLEDKVTAKKRDLVQKEINLKNAEMALEEAQDKYEWPDIKWAELNVENAESAVAWAQWNLDEAETQEDIDYWTRTYQGAKAKLSVAQEKLDKILDEYDPDEVVIKKLQLELAQGNLADVREAVADAEQELDEARTSNLIISAPFDGLVTAVNISAGDVLKEVKEEDAGKVKVAIVLTDPNKFEADILVNEIDIYSIEEGDKASIEVDAIPGISLPAEVTSIASTGTIHQGVVNYEIKVEIESLQVVMQEQQGARQEAMREMQSGELPERLRQAIEEGLITQEKAEEMMAQRQQVQRGQQGQVPAVIPEDFQLREGLTVTVSIIIDERNDVLLVPNQAIITQGRQTFVRVMENGVIEQRSVRAGLSDWQYTEIVEGLSEGEKVVVSGAIATTTTQEEKSPGGIRIPGMKGLGR